MRQSNGGATPPESTGGEPVIVVGAGSGGLSAAFRLKQAGFPVRVFEADGHLGCRMVTLGLRDCRIDLAASIFPSTYRRSSSAAGDSSPTPLLTRFST